MKDLAAENAALKAELARISGGRAPRSEVRTNYGTGPARSAPRGGGGGSSESTEFKVSEHSDVNRVAGAISSRAREADAPTLLAIGPGSINQAIKAYAVARRNLKDEGEMDLIADIQFPYDDESGECHIVLNRCNQIDDSMGNSEITVKPASEHGKVAGAIAGRVRDGDRVFVCCRGPVGCFKAVKAIEVAGRYLQEDSKSLKFTAQLLQDQENSTYLHLSVLARNL